MDKILESYIKMILDGSAFSNWDIIPNKEERIKIAESVLEDNIEKFNLDYNIKDLDFLKEDDFKV